MTSVSQNKLSHPIIQFLCRALVDETIGPECAALSAAQWEQLAPLAVDEGVGAYLYWKARRDGWLAQISATARRTLETSYFHITANNLILSGELNKAMRLFAEAQIPSVVIKGSALLNTLYPDPGVRPMGDLDFLVRSQDLPQAVSLLKGCGYSNHEETQMGKEFHEDFGHHDHLQGGPNGQVILEVHFQLLAGERNRYAPSLGWFWGQTRPYPDGLGECIHVFSPTAQFLHQLLHLGLQHGMANARLKWFLDLHLLLCRYGQEMDWQEILDQARRHYWLAAIQAVLPELQRLFGTPIPAAAEPLMHTQPERRDVEYLANKSTASIAANDTVMNVISLSNLSWKSAVLFLLVYFFPQPAYLRGRYTELRWRWLPLYYLYHWLGAARKIPMLLRRAANSLVSRLARKPEAQAAPSAASHH